MPFKGGGYPWNIAGDNRAVLHIKNIDAPNDGVRRQAMAKLYFDGGEYNLPLQQMDAGQTVKIDLKKLRDDQVRDVLGNVIPLNVTGGQLDWSGRAGKGEFIGRLAEYDPLSGIASSFSCVGACPCDNGFASAVIYPGGISGFVGETFNLTSIENDTDCNQQAIYTYNVGATQSLQYSSSDESVMTVSGNIATLVGAGTAEITASWEAFTVETHCFLSAEGDCVDARCNSRPVSNPIVDTTGQVTPNVTLSNIDIDTDSITTVLGPLGSGTFTLTWIGSGTSFTLVQENRSAGTYSDSFKIANLPNGTTYTSVRATWLVNGQTGSSSRNYMLTVLGDYINTCYNTPAETDFSGVAVTAGTATSACVWSSRSFVASFLNSVNLNGSGVDNSNTQIQIEGVCNNPPTTSPAYNGRRYRRPTTITTSCGNAPDANVTVASSSLMCGTPVYINTIGRRTVQDTGGGLASDQLDNYMGVGRNTCNGWSNNRRKTVQLY